MNKPIIGIVGKPSIETDMWHYMNIVDDIRYALVKNGALVIGILPQEQKLDFKLDDEKDTSVLSSEEIENLKDIVSRVDGVILEGGLVSNKYEEVIAKICLAKDIPIIGICSGFNNLIKALDGNVHIDETMFHNQFGSKYAHNVLLEKDSKLYKILKKEVITVNSIHTYIATESDIKGYKIVARCPVDNTVEAIEFDNKRFAIGIKWHPELMEEMNPVFEEFIKKCGEKS